MLDDDQLGRARATLERLGRPLTLLVDPGPDAADPFSKALVAVLHHLAQLAGPKLELALVAAADRAPLPSFTVANVRYLAVPLHHELEPFLQLLLALSHASPPAEAIEPAHVEVLIAPTCPNCPRAVAACGEVAAAQPSLELTVIDVQHFPELARTCRSVPTVIIDGTRTIVGTLTGEELLHALRDRDRPDHLSRAIGSMIEAGRLEDVAPLLGSDESLAALASLLREGSMQQKMGLWLVVEALLEENRHALDGALPHLLPLLGADDATVRGDTADLLGKIGAPGAREALTRLLSDENPDVRELAAESLAMLRAPS